MTQEPVIIDIQEPPENAAQQVVDILLGSFGLAGAMFIAAVVLGALLAAFLYWRKSGSDSTSSLTR